MAPPAAAALGPVLPIAEISAYNVRWTIRVRVTGRSQLRSFAKGGGQGKVFSCELLDKDGGEIRANFFNEAADKYYDMLQVGKCFELSRGSVKVANPRFNKTRHRYELSFNVGAHISELDEDAEIEAMKFNFSDLRAVQARESLPHVFDICGVIVSYRPPLTFTSKEGKELTKCELTIADDTSMALDVTLWGERALQESSFQGQPVVAMKGIIVKEWNGGRAGSLLQDGAIVFDPKGAEAERIRDWWSRNGTASSLTALSVRGPTGGVARNAPEVSLAELRKVVDRVGEQAEYFNVVARLGLVQTRRQGQTQQLTYMACQEPREGSNGLLCNKRVDEAGFCMSCNKLSKAAARMTARCRYSDSSDAAWLTTFQDASPEVLGMSAEAARALEISGKDLEPSLRAAYFARPLRMTVKAQMQTYNGEPRANMVCIQAKPIDCREHGRHLLREAAEMLAGL